MNLPLFTRVDTVFLPVRDLESAVDWYQRTLGLELLWQVEGAACLRLDQTPLTLLQHGFPGHSEAPDGHVFRPVDQVVFNLFVHDIEAAHRLLADAGAQVGDLEDHGEVRDFTFRDPDGNCLGVCWWPE